MNDKLNMVKVMKRLMRKLAIDVNLREFNCLGKDRGTNKMKQKMAFHTNYPFLLSPNQSGKSAPHSTKVLAIVVLNRTT